MLRLYLSAGVQTANEAVTVILHASMLDSGFLPKDVPFAEKYQYMPKDWNAKGIFKIKYEHFCCPSYTCYMTCVPLYNNISAHGIICDMDCPESVNIKVNVKEYVKEGKDFSNLLEVFPNFNDLSRFLKDSFCLPLLNLLHETSGVGRLFGFRSLIDELKVCILEYLPVESVISMSLVNKNLNSLTNSPLLWKHLYLRDFSKGGVLDVDTSSPNNPWKLMYIKQHNRKKLRKQQQEEERFYRMPRFRRPQMFHIGPDYDSDLSIDFDPLPSVLDAPFPDRLEAHLRNMFGANLRNMFGRL